MTVRSFIHRHYSPEVGESPIGHAAVILAGLVLLIIGGGLIASVVFVPAGVTIGVLGLLVLGGGVFAHIRSPLTFRDLMDTVISMSGAAIAATFAIAVVVMIIGFGLTVLVSAFRWLAS